MTYFDTRQGNVLSPDQRCRPGLSPAASAGRLDGVITQYLATSVSCAEDTTAWPTTTPNTHNESRRRATSQAVGSVTWPAKSTSPLARCRIRYRKG